MLSSAHHYLAVAGGPGGSLPVPVIIIIAVVIVIVGIVMFVRNRGR